MIEPRSRGLLDTRLRGYDGCGWSCTISVIASEATRQSILSLRGCMDCFAEPVIGRRYAPTRWLAMTALGCQATKLLHAVPRINPLVTSFLYTLPTISPLSRACAEWVVSCCVSIYWPCLLYTSDAADE